MLTPLGQRGSQRDEGFSLPEVLVVVILMGALLTVLSRGYLQTFTNTRQAQVRSDVTGRVQNALEALSRDVRVADPVVSGTATSLTANVLRSGNCYARTWTLSGTALSQTTVTYPGTQICTGTSSGTSTNTAFLTNVGNGSTPVFTYLDANGGATTAAAARQIKIVLVGTPANGSPVSLQAVVDVRNAS